MLKKIICLTCASTAIFYGATTLAAQKQSKPYYTVQVAAGFSRAAAEKSLNILPKNNTLRIVEVKQNNKPTVYKVVLGNYTKYAQAKKSLCTQKVNKNAYIVRIDNQSTISAPSQTKPVQAKKVKSFAKKAPKVKSFAKKALNIKTLTAVNNKKLSPQKPEKVVSKTVKTTAKKAVNKKTERSPTAIREGYYPAATFKLREGSLKHNVQRFANKFKYRLVWKVTDTSNGLPADYTWLGHETLQGNNPMNLLHKIVTPYNIETQVWQKNRIICISNTHSCNK